MKKLKKIVTFFSLMITTGLLCSCGSVNKEETLSRIQTAYENLCAIEQLIYEYKLTGEAEGSSYEQKYLVSKIEDNWEYDFYVDGELYLSKKSQDGIFYEKVVSLEEWREASESSEPPFISDILVKAEDIKGISVEDGDNTIITITINDEALEDMRNNLITVGEETIAQLESSGADEALIEAQRVQNEYFAQITYLSVTHRYIINPDNVLVGYEIISKGTAPKTGEQTSTVTFFVTE